jgi:hypothetical protein
MIYYHNWKRLFSVWEMPWGVKYHRSGIFFAVCEVRAEVEERVEHSTVVCNSDRLRSRRSSRNSGWRKSSASKHLVCSIVNVEYKRWIYFDYLYMLLVKLRRTNAGRTKNRALLKRKRINFQNDNRWTTQYFRFGKGCDCRDKAIRWYGAES